MQFSGGPLGTEDEAQIHSLIVYMNGDGMHSRGAYIQVYAEDEGRSPTGHYVWHPAHTTEETP